MSSKVDGKGRPFVSGKKMHRRPAVIERHPIIRSGRLGQTSSIINMNGTRIAPTRDDIENKPIALVLKEIKNRFIFNLSKRFPTRMW